MEEGEEEFEGGVDEEETIEEVRISGKTAFINGSKLTCKYAAVFMEIF